jgi:hypothetical protein
MGEGETPRAIVEEFAAVIGRPAALSIVDAVGGTRVYLPARPRNDSWIVKAVGWELAVKLCAAFAVQGRRGHRLDIPMMAKPNRARRRLIRELTAAGLSSRQIARELHISQRTVHANRAEKS